MLNRFHDMSAHFCVKNIPDTHHYQALNFDVFLNQVENRMLRLGV